MTTTEHKNNENFINLIVRGEYDSAVIVCAIVDDNEAAHYVSVCNKVTGDAGEKFSVKQIPIGFHNIPSDSNGYSIGYDM